VSQECSKLTDSQYPYIGGPYSVPRFREITETTPDDNASENSYFGRQCFTRYYKARCPYDGEYPPGSQLNYLANIKAREKTDIKCLLSENNIRKSEILHPINYLEKNSFLYDYKSGCSNVATWKGAGIYLCHDVSFLPSLLFFGPTTSDCP